MNGFPLRCKKSCSPVNRILSPFAGASIIYLAPTSLSGSSCLPLPATSAILVSRRATRKVRDLPKYIWHSTRKVYPHHTLLHDSVRSYRTFSPLSRHMCRDGLFSVALLCLSLRKAHPLGGAMLYVVRIFLYRIYLQR